MNKEQELNFTGLNVPAKNELFANVLANKKVFANLESFEDKQNLFLNLLEDKELYNDHKNKLIVAKLFETFKSDLPEAEKQEDYSYTLSKGKELDVLYLSLVRNALKTMNENTLSIEDKKAFLDIVVSKAVENKIIAYPVNELPTYKADFTALYEKGMKKEDKAEVQAIEDILNLKTVLANPELSSVYEKTMLDYNLMRETLKSKMKI